MLTTWTGDYALHCAVLGIPPTEETYKVIKYLIKVMPDSVNLKSKQSGLTPLALAFSVHRLEAAQILIAAGADQTTRDREGANLLHRLLQKSDAPEKSTKALLDIVDERLIPSLLSERCSEYPGSQTPLARYVRSNKYWEENVPILKALLDFAAPTGNQHLELFDGSGDTPVHWAVKNKKQKYLEMMLECRPDLLYHENSVGRTPYELAEDAYIAECVCDEPRIPGSSHMSPLVDKPAEDFVKSEKAEPVNVKSIWRVCQGFMESNPGKRKLVSLLDANEVAKRLAGQYEKYRADGTRAEEQSDAGSEAEEVKDEVDEWYWPAYNWQE